jgi:hypothetical protein
MNRIQTRPAVISSWAHLWRAPASSRWVPGSSRTDRQAFYLHPATPPLHGPPMPNPGSTAHIPNNIHLQTPWDPTQVFLRQDTVRRTLEPPYSGPHKVIARTDKTLKIAVRGRKVTVSADRVKPAYILEAPHHSTGSPPAQPNSSPAKQDATTTPPPKTTRSGRMVHFPVRFTTYLSSAREGDVVTSTLRLIPFLHPSAAFSTAASYLAQFISFPQAKARHIIGPQRSLAPPISVSRSKTRPASHAHRLGQPTNGWAHVASGAAIFRYRIQRRILQLEDMLGYRTVQGAGALWFGNENIIFQAGKENLWNTSQFTVGEQPGRQLVYSLSMRSRRKTTRE